MRTDKVFLEILHNRMSGIVNEMGHIIHKTSFTPFVKEAWDFGQALVSTSGEIFAWSRSIGVAFMVAAPMDVLLTIADWEPGDVLILNDPYSSGGLCTHLPDFHLARPIFWQGELVAFAWDFIHSSDVGGLVPGSLAPSAVDIYQEGLRIPPAKLFRRGVLNQELRDLILANCRIPFLNWGDLKALISALQIGERRLHENIERYGLQAVRDGIADLLDYAELRSRDIISRIPDGVYSHSDYVELDFIGEPPARIKLTMTVAGSDIYLDFTGTDPQVRAALNLTSFSKNHHFITGGMVNYFFAIDPSIPLNKGMLRPFHVRIPPGTLLNCEPPAAVGVRFACTIRVMECQQACLSLATDGHPLAPATVRGIAPVAGSGLIGVTLLSTIHPQSGRQILNVVQPLWGGSGARPSKDGVDGMDFPAGYLRNVPIEVIETDLPVLMRSYRFRAERPPAGEFRGGLGLEMEVQVFTPNSIFTARGMERVELNPWGRAGGEPGTLSDSWVNFGTPAERHTGKIVALELQPGEMVRLVTSSGGAYGDPLARSPARVLADWRDEYLTVAEAEAVYGVIIRDGAVDLAATAAVRTARAGARAEAGAGLPPFDYGPGREAHERILPEPTQDRLVAVLTRRYAVPVRAFFKHRFWRLARAHAEAGYPPYAPTEVEGVLDEVEAALRQVPILE